MLWSTSGFFVKAPTFIDWDESARGMLFAFWRCLFATVVLLPLVRRPRFSWAMIPMCLAFLLMNVTFLSSMVLTTGANAIWLQNTAPAWVFLGGVVLLRERPSARDWILLLFALLGVCVILFFESRGQSVMGVLLGLLAGIFYGLVILFLRLLRNHDSFWLITLNHLVTAVVLLPFVVSQHDWPIGIQWPYLIGFGVLQMGVPYVFFARGLRRVAGHEAAGIALLEPLLVPVWVWVAWHGTPSYTPPAWWTFVGGGLILAGLLLRYTKTSSSSNA